jgi:uncharacterized protein YqgC (DUF456 family)
VTILLWTLACALVVIGFAGIVFPALPGTILIFLGLILAAWADDFRHVGVWTLSLIGLIAVASYFVDFVAAAAGAQRVGASKPALIGAGLGTLLGLPLGLIGVLFGPLIGAVAGEWITHRNVRRAGHVGMAAWIGFLIGTAVKIALAFSMIAIFVISRFWI